MKTDKQRIASQVKRAKTFRQIRAAKQRTDYWRQRWKTHPETMRANLDRINKARKEKADERTAKIVAVMARLPAVIPSWEFRAKVNEAIGDPQLYDRFLSCLRRRGLIRFDHETLCWHLANVSPR